jgi:hypothetical protein
MILLLGLMLMAQSVGAKEVKLTDGWAIYISPNAGGTERFARDELRKYVEKMSGARLGEAQSPGPHTISLGLKKGLGNDGYSIAIAPDSIVIEGENPRGVLYGVYDLLERLGCRWYYPAIDPKDPEVVPRKTELILQTGKWNESAAIEDRIYWISGLAFKVRPETLAQLDWAAKNRFNCLSWQCVPENLDKELADMKKLGVFNELDKRGLRLHGPGHSFPYFLPTDKYFDKHPEWFGFRDGKRQPHGGKWPPTNYCLSNLEANEEFIRNVEAFVKKYPQIGILDTLPIDGGLPCQCAECLKSTPTDLLIAQYNRLAERLKKVAPNVIVDCVPGYGQLSDPPSKVFPSDDLAAVYAHWGRNHAESYDDPNYGRKGNLLTWQSYFKRFMICSYYAANSHQPFTGPPYLHALEGDTKYMAEHGVTGALVLEYPFGFWWENAFNVRLGGLHPYYYPKRDPKSELRDSALNYYGPKAGPLLAEYYEIIGSNENLEKTYRASRGESDDWEVGWLKDLQGMIRRAAQLASDDPVYSYRISKQDSAMEFLIELAPLRRKITDIEKAVADGAKKEDVEKQIAEARTMIADLIAHAEELGARNDGVMDADWMKGWTINRTFTDPLNAAEKKLAAK